jgi:phosphatidylglycerophosphatase A
VTDFVPVHFRDLAKHPLDFIAFGFGAGLSPFAPGTAGTVVGVVLFLGLSRLPLGGYLLGVLALLAVGVWVCERSSRRLGTHDHPGIVWDEVVGYLLTMTFASRDFAWMLVGFAAFRLFDIWKPWPIRLADRKVRGGLGIMLDDVLAAVYAAAALEVLDLRFG